MLTEKQTYKNKTIHLDGGTYIDCHFEGCTLIFFAVLPVVLDGCSFVDCRYEFGGAGRLQARR